MAERIWLDVPFDEKNKAKALGARWDGDEQRWYAPSEDAVKALRRWKPTGELSPDFPGEDREFGSGLFVDLIPQTCWFTNVRSCVSQRDWERIRRVVIERAGQKCEACGARRNVEKKRWLEVHERWAYDEDKKVQTLKRLICLCTDCHQSTHFGFAQVSGRGNQALAHLRKVTGMSKPKALRHIEAAFETWDERSQLTWRLDLSLLSKSDIKVTPPPNARERSRESNRAIKNQ